MSTATQANGAGKDGPQALASSQAVVRGGFRFFARVVSDAGENLTRDWVGRAEWAYREQAHRIYRELDRRMAAAGRLDGMCRQHIYQKNKRF